MLLDDGGQRVSADVEVEVPFGHGQGNLDATLESRGEILDEGSAERINAEVLRAMDAAPFELAEKDADVAVGVDGDASRQFAGAVQPVGVGKADFDPGGDPAGEIAHHDGRLVSIRQSGGHLDAFGVLEAVR